MCLFAKESPGNTDAGAKPAPAATFVKINLKSLSGPLA
jgi:hypothetical protein